LGTKVETKLIYSASQLVSHLTGLSIQPTKAIVGAKAFAYTSGMYENGVLRGRTDAEIIDPEEIGILEADYGGPLLTGRQGVRRILSQLGYTLDNDEFGRVYERFRTVMKKKPNPGLRDLEAIVSGETSVFVEETYQLKDVQITCGTSALPVAAVCVSGPEGDSTWATSQGNGPVDAAFKAVDSIVDVPNELLEYAVQSMTEGVDALANVTLRIQGEVPIGDSGHTETRIFLGRGADTDIIVASAKAYLFALNRYVAAQRAGSQRHAVGEEVRQQVEQMRARYGTAHTKDFMGWSILREEKLV
jgi:2-isopropylmalate synthase